MVPRGLYTGATMGRRDDHSSATVAPRSVNVFLSFSASSFERPSLSTWGSDSTNFFACTDTALCQHALHMGTGGKRRGKGGVGREREERRDAPR